VSLNFSARIRNHIKRLEIFSAVNPSGASLRFITKQIFAIGLGLTYYLGRMVKKQAHGWTVWGVMFALFFAGVLVCMVN